MVVEGIYNGTYCFISEIEEIRISEIKNELLNVQILVGGTEIFNENYYASDNTVKIYEIGKILRDYFLLEEPKGISDNVIFYHLPSLPVTIVVSYGQETVRNSFNAYFSRCRTSVSPSDTLFLTHENTIRTAYDRMEYLTFIVREGISVEIGVAYLNMGKEKYKMISQELDGCSGMVSVLFSSGRIAEISGVDVPSIIYYDVMLKENGVVKDKVRFVKDDRRYRNVTNFIYQNAFGMPETMTFTGLAEYSPELEGDLVELLQKTARTDTGCIDSRTVNSGYLDSRQYDKVLDMITTTSLHLYDSDTLKEVVVTDIDFLHKRIGNEKINVTLTLRQASRMHLAFRRAANIHERIFDKSFDRTFE